MLRSAHAAGSAAIARHDDRFRRVFVCSWRVVGGLRRGRRRAIRSRSTPPAERWVEQTLKKLTLDEKIGQLIVPSFESNFLSTDSDTFDTLARLVREYHVGGFHVFGAIAARAVGAAEPGLRHGDPRPAVRGRVSDQPAAGAVGRAAAEHRRLRDRRRLPHLRRDRVSAADGDGRDRRRRGLRLVREEARITAHRIARARRAGEFRAGRRRQQQPAQPRDQHAIVRRGPGARRRAGRRLRRRRARRRHDRDDQAFSRPRRHRRRQPPRAAGDHATIARASIASSWCRSAAASSRAPRR